MKYIDIEKLKAHIEAKMEILWDKLPDADKEHPTDIELRDLGRYMALEGLIDDLDSLQQEQPNRPDFEDVDPKHLVHSHYTKVRETKTGRVFWAEYSSEAAEWYEAGTGKAYSISDVEIVKEQPEVDLEKEIDSCWQSWISPSSQSSVEGVLPKSEFSMYARHFYELGKNSK